MSALFNVQACPKFVEVSVGTATAEQAEALVNVLERACKFGRFEERVEAGQGYRTMRLRMNVEFADAIAQFVASLSVADLFAESEVLRKANAERAIKLAAVAAEQEHIMALSALGFAALMADRSGGKLSIARESGDDLVLSAKERMPVTHFKALARLAKYNYRTREFTTRGNDLGLRTREGLLVLADKLSRTRTNLTKVDIAARKPRIASKRRATSGPLDMDYAEACEDFGKIQALEWYRAGRLTDRPVRPDQYPGDPATVAPW